MFPDTIFLDALVLAAARAEFNVPLRIMLQQWKPSGHGPAFHSEGGKICICIHLSNSADGIRSLLRLRFSGQKSSFKRIFKQLIPSALFMGVMSQLRKELHSGLGGCCSSLFLQDI
mgnify:CR=1 FL=1